MKTRTRNSNRKGRIGFSLVELLVVIAIIVALAAVTFVMTTRLKKRAEGVKAVQNMKQIAPMLAGYAVDNNGRLPAPRGDMPDGNGGFTQLHWHETVMQQAYSGVSPDLLRNDQWWEETDPFLRNPLCDKYSKEWPFAWWNPGYAMNMKIARNLGLVKSEDWGPGKDGPQTHGVPLSLISEPARTPIIAPRANWHYEYTPSQINEDGLVPFLVDGKMPILFVDGHIESMKLTEYTDRKLHLMPKK
jgi:prepilin-type N-terminal cleavage/methylation domain-containing protein/prepilin-type processing-associated H-X9-DG protein